MHTHSLDRLHGRGDGRTGGRTPSDRAALRCLIVRRPPRRHHRQRRSLARSLLPFGDEEEGGSEKAAMAERGGTDRPTDHPSASVP